jgi:predicted Zn-dependent protease
LRKGLYLLKEIGILVAAVAAMVILAFGITWFLKYRTTDRGGEVRPAVLSIESALRSLISESIKTSDHTVETPELDSALHTITRRLLEETEPLPYEVEILVLNSPVVNAVNFPGGLIVVYSGMIGALGSSEEMAAVIAHELGHVVNMDSIKSLMRQMGIATFFSVFGGRGGQIMIQRMLREATNIKFSRSVEQRADDFALELLIASEIDPVRMGEALTSLKREGDADYMKVLRYIDSHPDIDSRIKKAYERSSSAGISEQTFNISWEAVKGSLPAP